MSPEVVWRYLRDGKVKHAFYGVPGQNTSARCGVGPRWWDPKGWMGAGSVADAEALDLLQPCKRCMDNLGRDRVPDGQS